jgi:hypothetical protein
VVTLGEDTDLYRNGIRADSCPISIRSAGNMETWVNDYVITSCSSLDLLVPDEPLVQECAAEWGSLRTMPVLPDSEHGMGCGQLQYDGSMT